MVKDLPALEFPTVSEVRNDFSAVVRDLEFLIETLSTKTKMSFFEYLGQLGTINVELIKLQGKIDGLIAADLMKKIKETGSLKANGQYSKASGEMQNILERMLIGTREIERKHLGKDRFFSWERVYEVSKKRNDLIKHFTIVSKELTKIQKRI
jgi:hypothetical protein